MLQKLCFAAVAASSLALSAQTPAEWKAMKSDVNLMVVSDLGRNGHYMQKPVAATMGRVAEAYGPDAVLALGDTHHYQGVQSVADPLWMTNFEQIYSHPELQVEWYPILGNHEYRGNTQAVLDYTGVSRRWNMPARYYTRVFEDDGVSVRVIFLDTTPLIDKYSKKSETYPDAVLQDADSQLQWLDSQLDAAAEDWIVVVGHHPVYADTDKPASERTDMQRRVDAILRRHRVDMYICGHIHNFQHIRMPGSGIDYVVNASGSLSRGAGATQGSQFFKDTEGFSLLSASPTALSLYMLDSTGAPVHTVTRTR